MFAVLKGFDKLGKLETLATVSLVGNTKSGEYVFATAASFCFYGLIKKQVPLPATISLALETVIVAPIALVYLLLSPHVMTQDDIE